MSSNSGINYTTEYLAENTGSSLNHLSISFIVVLTVFVSMFYVARWENKTLNGAEVWCFIPLGYLFCIGVCIDGICEYIISPQLVVIDSFAVMVKIGRAGTHVVKVLMEDGQALTKWLKIEKAAEFLYIL